MISLKNNHVSNIGRDGCNTGFLLQELVFPKGCTDRDFLQREKVSQMWLSVIFHGPRLCSTKPEDFNFTDTLKR